MVGVTRMRESDPYQIPPAQMPPAHSPRAQKMPPPATPAGAAHEALHVCGRCGAAHVHPLDWMEESPERWRIVLRCPDCEHRREGVFGRGIVERLDDELDRASAALLGDYTRLVRANMSGEIELFVRALQLDLIGPADFQQ
jgi:DNA-directed RNA polymerase subunit RPC12/RpoP